MHPERFEILDSVEENSPSHGEGCEPTIGNGSQSRCPAEAIFVGRVDFAGSAEDGVEKYTQ